MMLVNRVGRQLRKLERQGILLALTSIHVLGIEDIITREVDPHETKNTR